MAIRSPNPAEKSAAKKRSELAFTEAQTWASFGDGWRQLSGNFPNLGYSIEWHSFTVNRDLDWSESFHPNGVEICLNLEGCGEVHAGSRALEFTPSSAGFYVQGGRCLNAFRRGGERHRFITIELALPFLERHLGPGSKGLHPRLGNLFTQSVRSSGVVSEPMRLTSEQQQLVMSLRRPPVCAAAQAMWYHGKVLEVAAGVLYQPAAAEELFCQRYKRLSQERVLKVAAILKQNLAEPPPLEEIGRQAGCSQFHLSRLFTQEMGKTISAHLRDLRMERAAELLRDGRTNVTEAALEVGYSSLSHFTATFRAAFGCCPGLYPLKAHQRNAKR